MNLLLDVQIIGWLLLVLAGLELLPVPVALYYGDPTLPYVASAAAALLYGLPITLSVRSPDRRLRTRDGFVVVTTAWFIASIFGGLPYVLSGTLSPIDAFFETASGFTTTGSTVMTHIDAAPRALLLWRSLTQWVGGMGIIVFAIAVLPLLGIGGMQLFRAEVPGPVTDKLTPRIAVTARRLWFIYLGFTLGTIAALSLAGMGLFDAVCHAFTSTATGGFSTRDASIGGFRSPAIEWVMIVVMMLAGTNFALHYRLLAGRARRVSRDEELRLYLALAFVLVAAAVWILRIGGHPEAGIRVAAFQVVSIMTTTGYATADYELWPAMARLLIFHVLVIGGMAGSTAGGVKTLRLLLSLRALRIFVLRFSHPQSVRRVRYAGRPVPDDVMSGVLLFLLAYLIVAVVAAMIVSAGGYDPVTSMSAALTALGNVGPGLGAVGPTDTFAPFPGYAKLVLAFCMIAGRLELFTVLVLFEPHFWRR